MRLGGLRTLLQPGDVRDQALPLRLPLVTGGLERLELRLDGFQLLLQVTRQVLETRLVFRELRPAFLPLLLELCLLGDGGIAILQ